MASHTVGTKEGKTERRLPTTIKNGANVRQSGGVRDKYRKMTGGVFSTASTAAAGCALQEKQKKKVEHFGHHEAFGDPGYDLLM